jgi:tRNA pseudouridine55 synthase
MITHDKRPLNGFVVIDKPAGWTSHDVVAYTRRLLANRKVGHAGTLDPTATGVLPLAIGSATKVLEYLFEASKTYIAEVTFGVETDSYDAEGAVVDVRGAEHLVAADIERAVTAHRGEINQVPPMYSAIRVGGRRLYDLARKGEIVERAARRITIHRLDLLAWRPPVATVLIDCSKGTYVRSLAFDLGRFVETGAYLSDLVRVRTGPFCLGDAWTLKALRDQAIRDQWHAIAIHPDIVLDQMSTLLLDAPTSRRWLHGGAVTGSPGEQGLVRAYAETGAWLGVGSWDDEMSAWRPVKVVETDL